MAIVEYIFDLSKGALYDNETGEAVLMPKIVGKLIRCKDCKHYYVNEGRCPFTWAGDPYIDEKPAERDYCSRAEEKGG